MAEEGIAMIPAFVGGGHLSPGVWQCSSDEFFARFLNSPDRKKYIDSIKNIFDFAGYHGARSVLVGGSFVTRETSPRDFDCVILFERETQIPPRIHNLDIGGNSFDIYFASEDQPHIKNSFLKLFSVSRSFQKVGVVDVDINVSGRKSWNLTHEPDDTTFEIIRRAYTNRHVVDKIERKKALITVHGIRTNSDLSSDITTAASANGWIVSPFKYGYVWPTIFLDKSRREKIVDKFREHLEGIRSIYQPRYYSAIAYSFGTYVLLKYVLGFDNPPVKFDSIILCGAIVNQNQDLEIFRGRVGSILNEKAPNDEWVNGARFVNGGREPLFGSAGKYGFYNASDLLMQPESQVLKHGNVIMKDLITQRWLPFLESNVGSIDRHQLFSVLSDLGIEV